MEKIRKVNLDNLIQSRVHQPRVDGIPIYARVDGTAEMGEGRVAVKSPKWENAVRKSQNSPDNVRRVFITYKGVYVHYYKPISGTKSASLKVEKELKEVNLLEVKQHLENNTGLFHVKGTGISALVKPWVCSNIEEVYFDWSVLLSDDIRGMFGNIHPNQVSIEFVQALFNEICLRGTKDVSKRFPRLRAVGYVMNLDSMYHNIQDKPGAESLDDMKIPWGVNELMKSEIQNKRAVLWTTDVASLNKEYSIKPNIYTYDATVLQPYFEELVKRIERYAIDKIEKQKVIEDRPKGNFEKTLDSLYEMGGIKEASRGVKIALDGLSKSERQTMYETLTNDGQERYRSIFGL